VSGPLPGGNPWADPATPTEEGAPYAGPLYGGPPPTAPPSFGPYGAGPYGPSVHGYPPAPYGDPYGQPYGTPYGPPPYGYAYGHPPHGYWPTPPAPRRPGQVVTAAVLAFVQAGLVLLASGYVFLLAAAVDFAGTAGSAVSADGLATEGRVVASVQLVSAVLLIVAGVRLLGPRGRRRAWALGLAAFLLQVALSLYWAFRIAALLDDVPGPNPSGPFVSFALFFAVGPLVALGMLLFGPGRGWFAPEEDGAASTSSSPAIR